MEIRFLDGIQLTVLHQAFLRAFSDYIIPMQITLQQFEDLVTRRGVDWSLSIGAFESGELIGFNLNAIDTYEGVLSIYDSGTGTVPEFRRRGIAKTLFEQSLPRFMDRGAKQYVLEVFEENTSAVGLYQKIGFRTVRMLESFRRDIQSLIARKSTLKVREIDPDWNVFQQFWDWNPTWQNSIASIRRSKMERIVLGVFDNQELAGYAIVFPASGDISQFSIRQSQRRKGAATKLLNSVQNYAPDAKLRMINVYTEDRAMIRFLSNQGFAPIGTQLEMKLDLTK